MAGLVVNGEVRQLDGADPGMPLVWALRDLLGLTGTKHGCGIAQCGACTVHVDGVPQRSCQPRVGELAGRRITTIEGLHPEGRHPVQLAWQQEQVPQCGYCQSGQIMAAAALLAEQRNFDSFALLRLPEAPAVETHILSTPGAPVGGVGEPGVPCTAPAVCNAIFAATGRRIRGLPIDQHDLRGA